MLTLACNGPGFLIPPALGGRLARLGRQILVGARRFAGYCFHFLIARILARYGPLYMPGDTDD